MTYYFLRALICAVLAIAVSNCSNSTTQESSSRKLPQDSAASKTKKKPSSSQTSSENTDDDGDRISNDDDNPSEPIMEDEDEQEQPIPLGFSSSAFANNQPIPDTYVAKNGGGNMSPPLAWTTIPEGTGSFAIQMVDLDFRTPPFIHWVITDIPASSTSLPAGIPGGNNLTEPAEALGANQLSNYAGPNPPNLHRYEFTIYAIKEGAVLNLGNDSAANKANLEANSIEKATIIGTYE